MTTSPLASAVDAMKAHVPTSRHAEMLFAILVDRLGDHGVLWTANEGRLRKLFRRDPLDATLVVPWPVAQLSVGGRSRLAGLEWAGGSSGPPFDGVALEGDLEAALVRRHVKIPRPT